MPEPEPARTRAASCLRVHTGSGTTYLLDSGARTVRRLRGGDAGELRRDGEPIPLLRWPTPVVGQPMVLLLQVREDNPLPTVRITTPVRHIEP